MRTVNLLFITLGLSLISCTKDKTLYGTEESQPIRIGGMFNEEVTATTRAHAVWFNAFPGGEKVNFYIYDYTHSQYISNSDGTPVQIAALNQGHNILYKNVEDVIYMGFVDTYDYPTGCEQVSIHALYPTTVTNNTTNFTVNADQTTNANYQASDLMFADTVGAQRSAYPIMLEFKHQMAKIVVNISGTAIIKKIALQNVYSSINITPAACSLGSLAGSKGEVVVSSADEGITTSVAALIPPQSVESEYFLAVTTTDNKVAYFRSPSGGNFKSGKVYTFNLLVNTDFFNTSSPYYADLNFMGEFSSTTTAFYNYTGVTQRFVVPKTGKYLLEAWGAQGGISGQVASGVRTMGGSGGYSQATYTLKEGTILYITAGGAGGNIDDDGVPAVGGVAGYNGGGTGGNGTGGCCGGGGGGGATHIAIADGILEELVDNKDAVLLVAGGGGGASWVSYNSNGQRGYGGYGGGLNAGAGEWSNNTYDYKIKAPAGSMYGAGYENGKYYGYKFGRGQNGRDAISGSHGCEGNGGGGGGWYGGYSYSPGYYEIIRYVSTTDSLCRWITDTKDELTADQLSKLNKFSTVGGVIYKSAAGNGSDTAGGGGSGYINESINTETVKYVSGYMKAGNEIFESPSGDTMTGHSGSGVARITYIGE